MHTLEMHNIEQLTRNYKNAHDVLADRILELQSELDKIKRARIRGIKSALGKVANTRNALKIAISENQQLFVKPRTTVFYGVKVGLQKAKGKLKFNKENVVKRVRKLFPKKFIQLVKTEYKPIKGALEKMAVDDLKRLGVEISGAGDQVVVKLEDNDIDKMVDSLLSDFDDHLLCDSEATA